MRIPSLDAYDMAGIRSDEAAGLDEDGRAAWDDYHDADRRDDVEQLLR
ncbi:hypothetical protein [Streptomyces sp. CB03911]|nr:hypothetical protein [Streptomyces sp. CB03911]